MDIFADYILNETDLATKMEIAYYLSKKTGIYFNKSVVFKTEIARLFLENMKIEVDKNLVLTACLLCNCKKVDDAQKIGKLHTYALEGAKYLEKVGFSKRFCKICEEVNRYSNSNPREKESDILELVDQFGGMLLDRPERIGFETDEALVLLEYRNLKDKYNRYLESFIEFVKEIDSIELDGIVKMKPLKRLVKIHNETEEIKTFIVKVAYDFEPKVDKAMEEKRRKQTEEMLKREKNPNRPLFSAETTRKIMGAANSNEIEA